ncbi:MAG: TetR/AcrR family transcriptional regulator [Shimia sp.]
MSYPPEPRPDSRRRREVAQAALAVFLERGYAGTSMAQMAQVARAAGVTKAALYHHFDTKEELFVGALAADASRPLDTLDAQAADPGGDAAERWRAALGHAHDAVHQGSMGRMLVVLTQTGGTVPEVARGFHERVIARFRMSLRAIYADAIAAGTHRPLPLRDVDHVVFGPLLSNALTQSLVRSATELHDENLTGTDRAAFVEMVERLTRIDPGLRIEP